MVFSMNVFKNKYVGKIKNKKRKNRALNKNVFTSMVHRHQQTVVWQWSATDAVILYFIYFLVSIALLAVSHRRQEHCHSPSLLSDYFQTARLYHVFQVGGHPPSLLDMATCCTRVLWSSNCSGDASVKSYAARGTVFKPLYLGLGKSGMPHWRV